MKGDFSRDSFDPGRHFTRVLLQQGRVLTDADFNEQAAIQQHFLRAFVIDLVERRWRVGEGFAIGAGRFYLGGMACENADALPLSHAAGRAGARRRWSRRRGRSRPRVRRLSRRLGAVGLGRRGPGAARSRARTRAGCCDRRPPCCAHVRRSACDGSHSARIPNWVQLRLNHCPCWWRRQTLGCHAGEGRHS